MSNINVAVIGSNNFADKVGKRGNATDITFYEIKNGNDSVTLIEPSKYPDKISSLFYSVSMAEKVILVVEKVDNFLGESILMVDSMGIGDGWIVLRNYIQPQQIKPLLIGTSLEGYNYVEDDPIKIRTMLIDLASNTTNIVDDNACGSCPIDRHFNVKGVGTVVLGSVIDGCFKVHDKMTIFPLKKEVVLKSIQKHDIDASNAIKGDHVGLALRGIESDELDRGYVITTDPSIKMIREIDVKASLTKYWPSALKKDMVIHVGHWMQIIACRVISSNDDGDFRSPNISLKFESDLIYKPDDKAIIMYLEGGKLRVIGSMILN